MSEHDLNRFQSPPDLSTMVSPAVDPRVVRLALALMAVPGMGYAGYKAYQHFHPQAEDAAENAKTAMLHRYGIDKEALSPLTRNMLIGVGVGGLAGGGLDYAVHRDKPDALERAGKASIGGALVGGIAGGLLTRPDSPRPPPDPEFLSGQGPSEFLLELRNQRDQLRQLNQRFNAIRETTPPEVLAEKIRKFRERSRTGT